ncbi:MAG: class I tRNA ligase family protein [Patescibacteria group bacterium]|nr:class I tRNA ligase family protein [Patescibacteria group bacterium]
MASERYDHASVEKKWQERWAKEGIYRAQDSGKGKVYVLDMFPYPSGEGLHVGHPKGYIATDIYSRHMRMRGHNVLHPMGWDAFGLPAENYALQNKVHPRVAVERNIAYFKEQLAHIGFDYDWSREINTTDPAYYKWTQWIFLQLFKKGLAYMSDEPINWCPSCMTGLANEDLDGTACERCGTPVEKKKLPQWVLKITAYADRMLADLDALKWPEHIKEAQRNWIGRSEGLTFTSPVKDTSLTIDTFSAHFEAFFADTFVVIAPDHPLLPTLLEGLPNKEKILKEAQAMTDKRAAQGYDQIKEPEGIFTGRYTVDSVGNGELPIWIANYALADYGTGIVKCSAHDERDYAFAKKYNIPLKEVLEPVHVQKTGSSTFHEGEPFVEHHGVIVLLKKWDEDKYLGLRWKDAPDWGTLLTGAIEKGGGGEETARREIEEETGYTDIKSVRTLGTIHGKYYHVPKKQNRIGHTPVFVIELGSDKRVPLSQEEESKHKLVWLTPAELGSFLTPATHKYALRKLLGTAGAWTDFSNAILIEPAEFAGKVARDVREEVADYAVKKGFAKKTVTYKIKDWVFSRQRYWGEPIPIVHCPTDGPVAVPEDQLPVRLPEVEHYEPSGTGESPLANIAAWVNTTCPKCGGPAKRETNTMPQWAGSSWYYLRFMDPHNDHTLVGKDKDKYWAPVDVYVGGDHAVRHLIYARFWHKFLYDIGVVSTTEPFARLEFLGFILAEDGRKMSKRYGNVINPDDVVAQYGADAFRIYEMFMGPFENTVAWSTASIQGAARFVERIWKLAHKPLTEDPASAELESVLHQTAKKVGEDIEAFKFNTAVSQMMICLNAMEKAPALRVGQWKAFMRLLAPFAPHLAEELWAYFGEPFSIHTAAWPQYDPAKIVSNTVQVAVQVNGKTRASIELSPTAAEEEALSAARKAVEKWLTGPEKKAVYVPGRIVSFVI